MRKTFLALLALGIVVAAIVGTSDDTLGCENGHRLFELRIYKTYPGKLDDLKKRFRENYQRLLQETRHRSHRLLDAGQRTGGGKHVHLSFGPP